MSDGKTPTVEQRIERIEAMLTEIHTALHSEIVRGRAEAARRRDDESREERQQKRFDDDRPARVKLMSSFIATRCNAGQNHRCSMLAFVEVWNDFYARQTAPVACDFYDSRIVAEFAALANATACDVPNRAWVPAPGFDGVSIKPEHRSLGDSENPADNDRAKEIMRARHAGKAVVSV